MQQDIGLAPSRPPCSASERQAAEWMAGQLRRLGLHPSIESLRAPTSPTWAPLLRAFLRVWAGAFLVAGWNLVALGLAGASIVGGTRLAAGFTRYLPAMGSVAHNVACVRRGTSRQATAIVVVAHLDTHSLAHSPPARVQSLVAFASAGLAMLTAGVNQAAYSAGWRTLATAVAIEGALQIVWYARRELRRQEELPDDNTSGLHALVRLGELLFRRPPLHDTWLVATAAATTGSQGLRAFLRSHPRLQRRAWVVEIDALGGGEVVLNPFSARFPHPGTPSSLVRAVEAAGVRTGDPLKVRRQRRSHSDAQAALRRRTPGITITGGLHPPDVVSGLPDPANIERTALVVASLAHGKVAATETRPLTDNS